MSCQLRRVPADLAGLTWTSQRGPDGMLSWLCPACTRAHLREIETGLPQTTGSGARAA